MQTQLLTAEFVFPGHPDKICDAIADGVVAEAIRRDPLAACGVEVAIFQEKVVLTGQVAGKDSETIDVPAIVRNTVLKAGYGDTWRPLLDELDIQDAVFREPLPKEKRAGRSLSEDQVVVTGYAVDCPETNYLPVEQWVAYRLSRRLEQLRCSEPELRLGPDGKLQVILELNGEQCALGSFNCSIQQSSLGSSIDLIRKTREALQEELKVLAAEVPNLDARVPDDITVNGRGDFEQGGTFGDSGLSGKKLVIDAYGPRIPIGGGALSGKDFFKPDRGGAILARRIAKAVVLTGVARECTSTLVIFPGEGSFSLLSLVDENKSQLDTKRWSSLFDTRLSACHCYAKGIKDWYNLAVHGHFTDSAHTWERLEF